MPVWARISRFLPAAAIVVVTARAVQEVLAHGQWPAVIPCVAWAVWRLSRRETRLFVEVFRTVLGLFLVVGLTRVVAAPPSPTELAGWALTLGFLWILTLPETEPGPDPEHLRTRSVGVDFSQ